MDPMTKLDEAAAQYRKAKQALDDARETAAKAVAEALRAGQRPTDVTARSPFTASHHDSTHECPTTSTGASHSSAPLA